MFFLLLQQRLDILFGAAGEARENSYLIHGFPRPFLPYRIAAVRRRIAMERAEQLNQAHPFPTCEIDRYKSASWQRTLS